MGNSTLYISPQEDVFATLSIALLVRLWAIGYPYPLATSPARPIGNIRAITKLSEYKPMQRSTIPPPRSILRHIKQHSLINCTPTAATVQYGQNCLDVNKTQNFTYLLYTWRTATTLWTEANMSQWWRKTGGSSRSQQSRAVRLKDILGGNFMPLFSPRSNRLITLSDCKDDVALTFTETHRIYALSAFVHLFDNLCSVPHRSNSYDLYLESSHMLLQPRLFLYSGCRTLSRNLRDTFALRVHTLWTD